MCAFISNIKAKEIFETQKTKVICVLILILFPSIPVSILPGRICTRSFHERN